MKELTHVSGMEIDSQIEKYLSQSSLLDIRTDRDTHLFRQFKQKFGKVSVTSKGKKNDYVKSVHVTDKNISRKLGTKFLLKVELLMKRI
jgi:hypothetical protein